MKESLKSSDHELQVDQRMPHLLSFWLFAVVLLLLMTSRIQAAEQQHKIEKLMRELQFKYYTISMVSGGQAPQPQYRLWPGCGTGPAPRYPKDGYYGDIERDRQMGVVLVQAAYEALFSIAGSFSQVGQDGRSGVEGQVAGPIPTISAVNWTFAGGITASTEITEVNYLEILDQVKAYNRTLQYLEVPVDQIGVDASSPERRDGALSSKFSSWEAAKGDAVAKHNQVAWTATSSYNQIGIAESAIWVVSESKYNARLVHSRGKLRANLKGIAGDLIVYVALDNFFGDLFKSDNPFQIAQTDMGKWKVYKETVASSEFLSEELANGTPVITMEAPNDPNHAEPTVAWAIASATALFTCDWNHPPDPIDCCASCSGSCRPGKVQVNRTPGFGINLGTAGYDKSAGDLVINAPYPGADAANIDYLQRAAANGTESEISPAGVPGYLSSSGVVGQARVISGILVNIASATSQARNKLTFKLYKDGDVVAGGDIASGYQLGGAAAPYKTVTFEDVSELDTQGVSKKAKWKLTEEEDGNTLIHEWEWKAANYGWEKVTRNAGGEIFRKERTIVQAIGNSGTISTPTRGIIRHEFRWRETYITAMMSGATEVVQDKRSKTVRRLNWGADEIVEETINPDAVNGLTKTTKYSFEDDANTSTDYTRLKRIDYPFGGWEKLKYDSHGRLARVVRQFKNNADTTADTANRVTTFSFAEEGKLVTRVDKLQDIEIARRYTRHVPAPTDPMDPDFRFRKIKDIVCQAASAGETAADNLVTTSKFEDVPGSELRSVLRPDGILELHSHSVPANGEQEITVAIGQPNGDETDIVKGTKSTTTVTYTGKVKSRQVVDAFSGVTIEQELPSSWDDYGRPLIVADVKGRQIKYTYNNCCGADQVTDFDGAVTALKYDELHRLTERRRKFVKGGTGNTIQDEKDGTTLIYTYDALDRIVQVARRGTNGVDDTIMVLQNTVFNQGGEVYSESSAAANYAVTTYAEVTDIDDQEINRLKQTITYPDGGTSVTLYNQDGLIHSRSGTAVASRKFDYGAAPAGGEYVKEIAVADDGTAGEWVMRFLDPVGRIKQVNYPSPSGAQHTWEYNEKGQLTKEIDPDLNIVLYTYNSVGELEQVVGDQNRDGSVSGAGNDPITKVVREVANQSIPATNANTKVIRTIVYQHTSESTEVRRTEQHITTPDQWMKIGTASVRRQTVYAADGVRKEREYAPDGSRVEAEFRYGHLDSVTKFDSLNAITEQRSYDRFGDSHGRMRHMIEKRTPPTADVQTDFNTYDPADRIKQVTLPPPVAGGTRQTYSYNYDNLGRLTKITLPDSTTQAEKSEIRDYFHSGQLKRVSGARVYPVEYTYDTQLRLKTMTTWQNYAAPSSAATTTWNYDSQRGHLKEKVYPDNTKTEYTYTAAGRLETRKRPRAGATGGKITTTYGYNDLGLLETVSYNDGITPGMTYEYDRQNRPKSILRDGTKVEFTFNIANQLITEKYNSDGPNTVVPLSGYSVNMPVDSMLRPSGLTVTRGGVSYANQEFTYDGASRMKKVTMIRGAAANNFTATYRYATDRSLVNYVDFAYGTKAPLTTTHTHDDLGRLTSIGTPSVSAQGYQYNLANQREHMNTFVAHIGSRWTYSYDALGQLTTAERKHAFHFVTPDVAMPGHGFEYSHDDIGNRKWARPQGITGTAQTERTSTYSAASSVNQVGSRTVPGYLRVSGQSTADAIVTVNDSPVDRLMNHFAQEFFSKELQYDNSPGALYPLITNTLVMKQAAAVNTPSEPEDIVLQRVGRMFLPKTPETFTYSDDGNLTQDGRWVYTWDAENRLVGMVTRADVPVEAKKKLAFEYDYAGRRIRKQVWNWVNDDWVPSYDHAFLYQGWNLVVEADTDVNGSFRRECAWGLDLSGSRDGAGGVGGLLLQRTGQDVYAMSYDGSGNVTAMTILNGLDVPGIVDDHLPQYLGWGSPLVRAHYAYGPFGELIQASGPMAFGNPFRFSTKYCDDESDLYYYGFRYYNPNTGRWLSRDPIEEAGDANLYRSFLNDPISIIDRNGLDNQYATANPNYIGSMVYNNLPPNIQFTRMPILQQVDIPGEVILTAPGSFARPRPAFSYLTPTGQFRTETEYLGTDPLAVAGFRLPVEGILLFAAPELAFAKVARYLGRFSCAAKTAPITNPSRLLTAGTDVPNAGGVIRSFAQEGDQIYYRVFSGSLQGRFLTAVPPSSSAFAREALALPPGNQATFIQQVLVPGGTTLQRSRALPAFGARGGAEQFELLQRIPAGNFGPGTPLP